MLFATPPEGDAPIPLNVCQLTLPLVVVAKLRPYTASVTFLMDDSPTVLAPPLPPAPDPELPHPASTIAHTHAASRLIAPNASTPFASSPRRTNNTRPMGRRESMRWGA